jgi:Beta-galactosidase
MEEPDMEALEANAVPASVLLSILRREMEDMFIRLSDLDECTLVFNHLLLRVHQSASQILSGATGLDVQSLRGRNNELFLMHVLLRVTIFLVLLPPALMAQVAVFWQPGFPTVASQPLDRATLVAALGDLHPASPLSFLDVEALQSPAALENTQLLVLPYGSGVPTAGWKAILAYLQHGGNLLVLGGQPLRVPVTLVDNNFVQGRPQDTYSRELNLRHSYEVPVASDAHFAWRSGYTFETTPRMRAEKFFTVEGHLNGLGYMVDATGLLVAAPVMVMDRALGSAMAGGRIVCLDFQPAPGYWASPDGMALIRQSAEYARQGPTSLSVEMLFSVLRQNEPPQVTAHLRQRSSASGEIRIELLSADKVLQASTLPVEAKELADLPAPFHAQLPPGFYKVRATYRQQGHFREFYENGFWVAEHDSLDQGPALGVKGDFLTRGGKPFFPVGTNYFTTEENGWDFSGPRNAAVWEKDFAEMAAHGVTFVRTGVWMNNAKFIDSGTGDANERFLRNFEAFLICAHHHGIAVNFTFFAFSPASGAPPDAAAPQKNPYIDKDALHAQQAYIRSVVTRFANVPWLCWDLINEPSFSNPQQIFKGNIPNGDDAELSAWRVWLRDKYKNPSALADAWGQAPEELGSFDSIPLPVAADLSYARHGNPRQVRAVDYNLFAQDMFSDWVKSMIAVIRQSGSTQLIDVGQDEGGVTNRVLNQFYGLAGVSFTTNHTYWQDDALLWDSIAAKLPGIPNITGETGYQPVWAPDGAWRYDEFTGLPLTERKWALGFAAGSSGAVQWDWAREVDFGMHRSDGSAKVWQPMMQRLGEFAQRAAPYATDFLKPDIAIILPQSFQLSVSNALAIEAQQNAVRALYNYARGEAYAVGECQIASLGSPKLIILPSSFVLAEDAWQAIVARVRAGAVLLVTGPFAGDPHFHPTERENQVGLPYLDVPLTLRSNAFTWPGGEQELIFAGNKTTVLSRAQMPGGRDWLEQPLGKGKILFASLPIELNQNLQAVGDIYRYAMKTANVSPTYTTALNDAGILICPMRLPKATLYVLTSETNQKAVSFHDVRSGKDFSSQLENGRAALLVISDEGKLITSYNWPQQ